jgi:hypothetical protein
MVVYCFHCPDDAVRTSETSVYFNETARRYIPERCHFHARRRDSLESHTSPLICVGVSYFSISPKEVTSSQMSSSVAKQCHPIFDLKPPSVVVRSVLIKANVCHA